MRRIDHDPTEHGDLSLHQQAGHCRQVLCHSRRRRVGAVSRTEGVVHVEVAQRGQLLGEGRVVFRLARMEAHVLQHHDLAILHRLHRGFNRRADAVVEVADRTADQLAQPLRQWSGSIGLIDLPIWAAEVGEQNDARLPFDEVLNSRNRLADPGIVDDPAVLHRDVEIDADQHALPGDVHVADGDFLQRPADRGVRGQFSRSPMNTVRSTTRHEYPHSLSYQLKTLPWRSPITMVNGASTIDE